MITPETIKNVIQKNGTRITAFYFPVNAATL